MNIGTFTKNEAGEIVGKISTFGAQFDGVAFEAITKSGNGPTHIITTDAGELGAAWEKTSEKEAFAKRRARPELSIFL